VPTVTDGPRRSRRPSWTTGERGRFVAASGAGATFAVALFALLVTRGRPDLLEWQRSGDFYDAQAHAWLAGRWSIPDGVLTIEKFLHDGHAYMYQGPFPALLRVPFAAVTTRFDGRLTQLSMLLAATVAMVGVTRLHWRVRRLVRPDAALRRADLVVAALATFAIGGGSALLYQASRSWVYHEAVMWGVAWTIVGIDAAVGCLQRPSRGRFVWAGLATTFAMCSRTSVALGAVAALAIIAAGNVVVRAVRRTDGIPVLGRLQWAASAPRSDGTFPVAAPTLAAFVPVAVYSAVNYIKFATLFSIPFYSQGFTLEDAQRRHFLDVNDGTLFGLKWVPTTVVQYARPDALRFTATFPFVDFPPPARPFSGVQFDLVDYTSSLPSSMPLLAILGIVGLWALLRARGGDPGTGVAALRGPTLGGLAGGLTILPFAYISNRYLADLVPALVIAGLIGVHTLLAATSRADAARPRWAVPVWGTLGFLLIAGLWINVSLALIFGRLYSSDVKDDVAAAFVDTQYDGGQALGLDPAIPLRADEALPNDAARGQLAIVGDCDALYLADGMPLNASKHHAWNPLVRSEAGGRYLRTITFPAEAPGTRLPLFTLTSRAGDGQLYAEWMGGAGVRFNYQGPGSGFRSPTLYLPPERTYTLDLVVDPRLEFVQVWLSNVLAFQSFYTTPADAEITIGADVLGDPLLTDVYTGRLDPLPERNVHLCEELRAEAEG
jgi:hypothetical protein